MPMITIGIDAHKRSHTANAIDEAEQVLDRLRISASVDQVDKLLTWAGRWPERRWAVEGAQGTGRLLAQQLVAAGETVVDVPPTLAARARLLDTGKAHKNDDVDSAATAVAGLRRRGLHDVAPEGFCQILRLLVDRRDQLCALRTRTVNRLHRHLADLIPGGGSRKLSAKAAARLLDGHTPATQVELERKLIARDLLDDIARLDAQIKDNHRRIREAVAASGTTLTGLFGIGHITAAMIIAHSSDPARFPSTGHYARYNGTAPIEASSGDVRRHRLNRGGNRQLNRALHVMAIAQIRHATDGRVYYQRKLDERKTDKEALRALKRQLSNVVYRRLLDDYQNGKIRQLPTAA
jgi:transposase